MPIYKHELTLPNQDTIDRIIEVQFFLFMKGFIYKYGQENRYINDLVNILSEIYECRPSSISIAKETLRAPGSRPTKLEISVAAFWLGIPIRQLAKVSEMSTKTYYNKLEEYRSSNQPDLQPRLNDTIRRDVFKFLENVDIMFNDSLLTIKGMSFYERYKQ